MPERHGYGVKFSVNNPNLLIVATSQQFGRKGSGTLFLLKQLPNNEIICLQSYEWADALFDADWCNGELICTASGDGSIQLWNSSDASSTTPAMCYKEHSEEVYSVDCKKNDVGRIISSSWDCTVKLWDILYSKTLSTYSDHSQLVYQSKFSPNHRDVFASVSGDGCLKFWNTNCSTAMITVQTNSPEVLTCDWNPTNPNVVATGGSEGLLKLWDIRHYSVPLLQVFSGCTAIRKIRYSPHNSDLLASVSYDGMTRIWNLSQPLDPAESIQNHTDSAFGLDWNPFRNNQLVDCGWDSFVEVFSSKVAGISN
ncbi:peroxisomal targeting signal 2 receptor [Bradysia coprophila]|uniref:peroxisomal targeting signal 2 receptor n=1 Tax=Bradysia coprophila TaxID=38358 RepID=UPI00187DDA54|nr:peroxisomal targeting signal 2 receptor [Bradysia coprophila]